MPHPVAPKFSYSFLLEEFLSVLGRRRVPFINGNQQRQYLVFSDATVLSVEYHHAVAIVPPSVLPSGGLVASDGEDFIESQFVCVCTACWFLHLSRAHVPTYLGQSPFFDLSHQGYPQARESSCTIGNAQRTHIPRKFSWISSISCSAYCGCSCLPQMRDFI